MNSKSFLLSSHSHSDREALATSPYLNQMFALILIGILAFLGVAWMLGRVSAVPLSEQSPLSLSTQVH